MLTVVPVHCSSTRISPGTEGALSADGTNAGATGATFIAFWHEEVVSRAVAAAKRPS